MYSQIELTVRMNCGQLIHFGISDFYLLVSDHFLLTVRRNATRSRLLFTWALEKYTCAVTLTSKIWTAIKSMCVDSWYIWCTTAFVYFFLAPSQFSTLEHSAGCQLWTIFWHFLCSGNFRTRLHQLNTAEHLHHNTFARQLIAIFAFSKSRHRT